MSNQTTSPNPAPAMADNDKLITIVATLPIIGAILFFASKTLTPLQKFYAKQSVALTVLLIIAWILGFFSFVPLLGWIFWLINLFLNLVVLVIWIICLIKALQGEMFRTPVMSDLVDQYIK